MPAPGSTATCAPRPISFLTVSGVAATRGSLVSASAGIAIFMLPPTRAWSSEAALQRQYGRERSGEEIGHQNEQDDHEGDAHFGELQKKPIRVFVLGIVVAGRRRVFDLAVVGHLVLQPVRCA